MALLPTGVAQASEGAAADVGAALTEVEALRRGLGRPALTGEIEAEADRARADEAAAGIWPNPVVSFSREQTYGSPAASREDSAVVTQSFDVSGRRGLRADAADRRVDAAVLRGSSRRAAVEAEIRTRFYTLLHLQQRVAAIEAWLDRTSAASDTIARREAAGDVSGYDRARLERERGGARAGLDLERAALARAAARLAAVVGEAPHATLSLRVAGELLPSSPLAPGGNMLARANSHPDLRAIEAEAEAAELEGDATGRWWVPDLALGGGVKTIGPSDDRATGFIVSGALTIPVFDRDQDEGLRAAASSRAARARLDLERSEVASEVRGAWAESLALAESATRFRAESAPAATDLVRTAEAAYAGGELGILELLDAHRGALDAELQALELEWGARRARIEFDHSMGGTPQ